MLKRTVLCLALIGLAVVASWIAFGSICNSDWRRVEQADFPWNGPNSRAAKYQKSTFNFPHSSTEERWENYKGEMVPYWPTISTAKKCVQESEFMAQIINSSKSAPESTTSPYHFYLVSIDPEIVIVSEQEPRKFDYWNTFVLPTTKIPRSKKLYWIQPDTNPEPVKIDVDANGNGSFELNEARFVIRRNSDKTVEVIRTSR